MKTDKKRLRQQQQQKNKSQSQSESQKQKQSSQSGSECESPQLQRLLKKPRKHQSSQHNKTKPIKHNLTQQQKYQLVMKNAVIYNNIQHNYTGKSKQFQNKMSERKRLNKNKIKKYLPTLAQTIFLNALRTGSTIIYLIDVQNMAERTISFKNRLSSVYKNKSHRVIDKINEIVDHYVSDYSQAYRKKITKTPYYVYVDQTNLKEIMKKIKEKDITNEVIVSDDVPSTELLAYTHPEDNHQFIVKVPCIDYYDENKNTKQCYTFQDVEDKKNPMDDFVLIYLYKALTSYYNHFKDNYDVPKTFFITNDNFLDWNR